MAFHQRQRAYIGVTTALCGLLTLGGPVSPSGLLLQAQASETRSDAPGKTVSLDVAAADLHTVVNMLEKQTGVEAVIRDGDNAFKPVNVHLEDASLEKALRTIALSARATVSKNADGVYVFDIDSSGLASQSPLLPVNFQNVSPAQIQPAAPALESADLHWRKLALQHAVPSELMKLMHWDKDLVIESPFVPLSLNGPRPDITSTPSPVIYPTNYNLQPTADTPSVPIGSGNAGPGGANYAQQAGRSATAGSPDSRAQFPGFPGGGGITPGGGAFGQPGGGAFGQPGGGGAFGQPGGNTTGGLGPGAALPPGVRRIYALQSDNSLLVEATPAGFNEVNQIVKILDIAPRQVQIKVEFVTATVADVDNLGINFDLVPYPGVELATQQGSSTITSSAQPTFLQYATGNIVAQLFQTLTRTRGKVVQAPIVTTTNNVEATIDVQNQIPFVTTSTTFNGGINSTATQSQQQNFLQTDTGLRITPRINSDDSVTMNLSPQIEDTNGLPSTSGGPPPTIRESIQTLRTVKSGDTMVLGGLVRKQESQSSQRIPLLSELPFIGGLFRTRGKQTNDSELLIFVTPTIINESNDSSAANANGGEAQNLTVSP